MFPDSVAMVKTDVFQKKLNYEPDKFTKFHENICGDRMHQRLRGDILAQNN